MDKELFDKLIANRERILGTPEFYHSRPDFAYFGVAYHTEGAVPIGVLLELWDAGHMQEKCSQCSGLVYVYNIGGSPLSGSHAWRGYCAGCECEVQEKRASNYGRLWIPVRDKVKEVAQEGIQPLAWDDLQRRLDMHPN